MRHAIHRASINKLPWLNFCVLYLTSINTLRLSTDITPIQQLGAVMSSCGNLHFLINRLNCEKFPLRGESVQSYNVDSFRAHVQNRYYHI